jgi:glutathionyl-hydroquinone reductase
MYAVESTSTWNKFVAAVDLLTALSSTSVGARCYATRPDCQWSLSDRGHYERFVDAADRYAVAANFALEGAARSLLMKEGVDTVFALAVQSAETRLEGLNFLIEMHGELGGPVADKKLIEKVLSAARVFE